MAFMTGQLVSVGPCCRCNIEFAMPDWMITARKADHQTFYCPQGHPQCWPEGKSENQQLREQVENLKAAKDFEQQQRRAAEATSERLRKAQKRAKKRTANGVCPCCHRTVSQMAAHMKTKHPDYVKDAAK